MSADAAIHRVHRAVLFIEPRLFEALALDDVAAAVGGSVFELHRLFTQVYGVSLAAYIRGRRLSEAAAMLHRTPMSILEIAMRCGYGSQAAFTRAFARYFGASPAKFRRGAGKPYVATGPATIPQLQHRDQLDATPQLSWLHHDRALLGLGGHASPDRLEDFVEQQQALANAVGDDVEAVGVAGPMGDGQAMAFFLGVDADCVQAEDSAPDTSLVSSCLARGLYAVFTHQGPADRVRDSIAYFAQAWSCESPLALADRPSAETFHLGDRAAAQLQVRLWIPLTSGREASR